MKVILTIPILFLLLTFFGLTRIQCQNIDTLIDVGGHKLHFNITRGKGIPILFEAGGGDDGTVWNPVLKQIALITGTTLITYDRAGFGKSSPDSSGQYVTTGIKALESGLQQLGYNGNIMLVAHSFGAFYAALYTNRHPEKVKIAVLIDGSSACSCREKLTILSDEDKVLKTLSFPLTIPVVDIVSDYPPFQNQTDMDTWKRCHQGFVRDASNRTGIVAYGCGHYIFEDNPTLVINSIVEAYSRILNKAESEAVIKKGMTYAIEGANELKKKETDYRHSEDDLNSWGYLLFRSGKIQEALEVFKLNVTLYPLSWNVYDSYGEALLKSGQKEEAIKMYQKSVELNPKNDNGKKVLEKISKQ